MDDPSVVIDLSAMLIKIARIITRTKEPRACAGRIVPMESGIIPEAGEGVMAPATIVRVCVVRLMMRLMMVIVMIIMIGVIHAKELADAIAHGGGAGTMVLVGGGVGVGVAVRVVGLGGLGVVRDVVGRVRGVVVRGVVGSGKVVGRMMTARVLDTEMRHGWKGKHGTYAVGVHDRGEVDGVVVVAGAVSAMAGVCASAAGTRRLHDEILGGGGVGRVGVLGTGRVVGGEWIIHDWATAQPNAVFIPPHRIGMRMCLDESTWLAHPRPSPT